MGSQRKGPRVFIEEHATASTCVAIDAPLVITNHDGQRRCETLIGNRYGARHASCHSSNLSKFPKATSVQLARQLLSGGFRHAPDLMHPDNERVILEVYPHPAMLELFHLPNTIKYKKGSVERKRSGQRELQNRLHELSLLSPPLECTPKLAKFLAIDTNSLRGAALKSNEDALDAIVCAYIAYYYWFWGSTGTHLFGDQESGYIIVPTLERSPDRCAAEPAPRA